MKEDAPEKATSISLQALEVVGEKSAVAVNKGDDISMSVDETLPVISGIKDGETYYGDTVVTIDEENLATVTVNGESVTGYRRQIHPEACSRKTNCDCHRQGR